MASSPSTPGPIAVYHLEGRRSFRIIWICEELGIPYELSTLR